jgi:hypothetical protein
VRACICDKTLLRQHSATYANVKEKTVKQGPYKYKWLEWFDYKYRIFIHLNDSDAKRGAAVSKQSIILNRKQTLTGLFSAIQLRAQTVRFHSIAVFGA